ncbi:MAG: diaminopimelate decarboxylase [Dehalococcoidales bacterium]|nr:diaminopimelate decarboxylase [Dehalococcoidales bacterium]
MTARPEIPRLVLFPITADVNAQGHLTLGGCDSVQLAADFGTPLYVFDEKGLRSQCATFKKEFGQRYADTTVLYASKAVALKAILTIAREEGLGLDVVSGGEMDIAQQAGVPMERLYFHGNNKSAEELGMALDRGVGRIVVDNFQELALLNDIARGKKRTPEILLRISPGVDPHTHQYNTTGIIDSKFGIPLSRGEEAVTAALAAKNVKLLGIHFHLGSAIFEVEPYPKGIEVILDFASGLQKKLGFVMKELDIGGGYAAQYVVDTPAPPISAYAEVVTATLMRKCRELKLEPPRLVIEPGRSIVARSAMALYRVGTIKDIPRVRRYVCVDGGMGDNIRQALYGAKHEALLANRATAKDTAVVTIAGKYCESGDILIRDIHLPEVTAGDILAVADCGAYCIPMASNYNAALKPAVVMVKDGKARLIRRRETFADLTRGEAV